MKRRIFLAGLFHETNTFVANSTGLSSFRITRGQELLGLRGDGSPIDGYLQAAGELGWETLPGLEYRAQPSGPLEEEVFQAYWEELRASLLSAQAQGIDAIFLVLHGAMASREIPDIEGELLRRVRALPGLETLPLIVVLDLHANVSAAMAEHSTAMVPYRENPHTDARDTAIRAVHILDRIWRLQQKPRNVYRHARVLLAPPSTGTASEPMHCLRELCNALQDAEGHIEVGLAAGFAHADTPDTGLSFWLVTEQPAEVCEKTLELLCRKALEKARKLLPVEVDPWSAVHRIAEERKFPALLVEPADNIGGGAPGDATFILRLLLDSSFENCGVIIADPETVEQLSACRPGDTVRIRLGGKSEGLDPGPVRVQVTLLSLSDGRFTLEDPQSHLASMIGTQIEMGPCAVVRARNVTVLITSRPTPPFDLGQWRSQGIQPEDFQVIGIKAAVAHRQAYNRIAASSYTVSTPGPCSSVLQSLKYQLISRPIYPLDSSP